MCSILPYYVVMYACVLLCVTPCCVVCKEMFPFIKFTTPGRLSPAPPPNWRIRGVHVRKGRPKQTIKRYSVSYFEPFIIFTNTRFFVVRCERTRYALLQRVRFEKATSAWQQKYAKSRCISAKIYPERILKCFPTASFRSGTRGKGGLFSSFFKY